MHYFACNVFLKNVWVTHPNPLPEGGPVPLHSPTFGRMWDFDPVHTFAPREHEKSQRSCVDVAIVSTGHWVERPSETISSLFFVLICSPKSFL